MKQKPKSTKTQAPSIDSGEALRRRAEAQLRKQPADRDEIAPEEARRLLHELEVHQIELEMQNEELRRAQEALEESRAKYFYLYDLAPVGYLTLSEQGLILEANLTAAKLLGVEKSQLVKKPVTRFIVREDQDIYYLHRKQLFETRARQVCELRMMGKGGVPFWVHIEAIATQGNDDTPVCRATLSDIIARKRVEEALARRTQELERSNEELKQFAYVASHDLQEPLRAVSGYLQLLERRYKDSLDAEASKFIDRSIAAAVRMRNLIQSLLAYSRVGSHGQPFETTDCQAVFEHTLADLQTMIEESEARVTCDPLPTVTADASQLAQVFQNLLSNALKFRNEKPPEIHIGVERKNRDWLFYVRDNGIGIEPQYAERVFLIFQRLHPRTEYPGTGIGLAICKKIVERHDGRIWLESELGEGSTFYFTIPAVSEQ